MKIYLWTLTFLLTFSTIGRLIWLGKGEFPARTTKDTAMDVAIDIVLIVWGVALIFR